MRDIARVVVFTVIGVTMLLSSSYASKEDPCKPNAWIIFHAGSSADAGDGVGWSDPVDSPPPLVTEESVYDSLSLLRQLFGRVLDGFRIGSTVDRDLNGTISSNHLQRDQGANPRQEVR